MARRGVVAPLLAALVLAGVASSFALGGSRAVVTHTDASWAAAVRLPFPASGRAVCALGSALTRAARNPQAKDGKVHVVKARRRAAAALQHACARAVAPHSHCRRLSRARAHASSSPPQFYAPWCGHW